MTALDIPELLLAVLGHLDQSSLARCSLVCHAWNEPATELMWAQVQDLEHLVVKSIPESTLKHFKHPSFYHLLTMPYPELIPQSQDTTEEVRPGQIPLDQALSNFKLLDIDWSNETKVFRKRTQRTTHLRITPSNLFSLLVMYILQDSHPTVLQNVFPRLTTLTLEGNHHAPMISQSITKIPSLRHITFETSSYRFRSPHLPSWRLACQSAIGLVSFTIKFIGDPEPKDYLGGVAESVWARFERIVPPLSLCPFALSRPWKHIHLPGRLVGNYMFSALASIEYLETLTITGSLNSLGGAGSVRYGECVFKSLHTLRLLDVASGESIFKGLTLSNVRHLELEYKLECEGASPSYPISYLTTMVQACPNASSVVYRVSDRAEGEFVDLFTDSAFESLLALGSLEKLVVQIPSQSSICLSDDFLDRAARSWPYLQDLDLDQRHSTQTLVTLQGLVPLARYCPQLRSLQLGIQPRHIHTVFNAELYMQESMEGPGNTCVLTYLNVGCPPVYSADAVAAFFSALFPNLRCIERPNSANSDLYSRGDYFVWSQVVRAVQERDRDLDNLARMLRTQDLTEKHGSANGDFILSSIDDSDEDYWAYSGSEDESYSSDDEE